MLRAAAGAARRTPAPYSDSVPEPVTDRAALGRDELRRALRERATGGPPRWQRAEHERDRALRLGGLLDAAAPGEEVCVSASALADALTRHAGTLPADQRARVLLAAQDVASGSPVPNTRAWGISLTERARRAVLADGSTVWVWHRDDPLRVRCEISGVTVTLRARDLIQGVFSAAVELSELAARVS